MGISRCRARAPLRACSPLSLMIACHTGRDTQMKAGGHKLLEDVSVSNGNVIGHVGRNELISTISWNMYVRNGPLGRSLLQAIVDLVFRKINDFPNPAVHSNLTKRFIKTRPGNDTWLRNTRA